MEKYKRESVFCELSKYDPTADKTDYIEITEWKNGEGVDININSKTSNSLIQVSHSEYKLIQALMLKLEEI